MYRKVFVLYTSCSPLRPGTRAHTKKFILRAKKKKNPPVHRPTRSHANMLATHPPLATYVTTVHILNCCSTFLPLMLTHQTLQPTCPPATHPQSTTALTTHIYKTLRKHSSKFPSFTMAAAVRNESTADIHEHCGFILAPLTICPSIVGLEGGEDTPPTRRRWRGTHHVQEPRAPGIYIYFHLASHPLFPYCLPILLPILFSALLFTDARGIFWPFSRFLI